MMALSQAWRDLAGIVRREGRFGDEGLLDVLDGIVLPTVGRRWLPHLPIMN